MDKQEVSSWLDYLIKKETVPACRVSLIIARACVLMTNNKILDGMINVYEQATERKEEGDGH